MITTPSIAAPNLPKICGDAVLRDRYRGCLLAGAAGDALGAHVEFMDLPRILKRFGEPGIRDYEATYGRIGAITDDTQMTLYTAEGVLRAYARWVDRGIGPAFGSVTARAYLRWLYTQGVHSPLVDPKTIDGWLSTHRSLFERRAPGNTCLSALRAMRLPGEKAANDSKGCGGVMRAAPVGMLMAHWLERNARTARIAETFQIGCDIAALTHGHPTGYLTAGVLAVLVALLLKGERLDDAVDDALIELRRHPGHEETLTAIEQARDLARTRPGQRNALIELGEGWIAEEALAMSLYCALGATDIESGIILAVNHSGDSDSTGSITGNLLGAIHGESSMPRRWLERLELCETIGAVADDLAAVRDWNLDTYADDTTEADFYFDRYPAG
jgi:ADP-ribosylglycohydrolase